MSPAEARDARLRELDAIAAKPPAEDCWLCGRGPKQETKAYVLDIPLCAGHQDEQVWMLRQAEELHPEGVCTATCGCMTPEELEAKYGPF